MAAGARGVQAPRAATSCRPSWATGLRFYQGFKNIIY